MTRASLPTPTTQNTLTEPDGPVWLDTATEGRALTLPRVDDLWIAAPGSIATTATSTFDTVDELIVALEQRCRTTGACAVGYLSYEGMLPWVDVPTARRDEYPLAAFMIGPSLTDVPSAVPGSPSVPAPPSPAGSSAPADYRQAIDRVLNAIREGDIYQANVTRRFSRLVDQHPREAYRRLRQLSPAPLAAYLDFGSWQILSSTMELLIDRVGHRAVSAPIKGTIRRSPSPAEDARQADRLRNSAKDQAEHVMIVDLVRNDLGRVAVPGGIDVTDFMRVEPYPRLWHLVSRISARLNKTTSHLDLLRAIAPGGSVTGAPKRRAVEIIAEVERSPRGVYCGAIGYLTADRMMFNLPIRTMTHHNSSYEIHAGGGIVADSATETEWLELMLKAEAMLAAIGKGPDGR